MPDLPDPAERIIPDPAPAAPAPAASQPPATPVGQENPAPAIPKIPASGASLPRSGPSLAPLPPKAAGSTAAPVPDPAQADVSAAPKHADGPVARPTIPLSKLEDFLHGGNAIVFAEEQRPSGAGAADEIDKREKKPTAFAETPFERNVREIGLKERPSGARTAAARDNSIPDASGPAISTSPDDLPRIRTYANDMSEEIRRRGETLTSIVGAEAKRSREEGTSAIIDPTLEKRQKRRAALFAIGIGLFVLIGIGAVVAAFILTRPAPAPVTYSSLIPVNERQGIEYSGSEPLANVLGDARNGASITLGDVEELVVTEGGAPLSAQDILQALGAPDALSRNASAIMVGIHAFDHTQPFLLVKVDAYDIAFQSMLSWEPRMDDGLGNFFRPYGLAAPTLNETPPPLSFTDGIFSNIDVRQSQTAWPIVYAFLRPDLLAITTNEATLRELVTRLSLETSN